ncbi:AAA family ATPase [Mycobacterium pseudokansasii]|uniref:AAA family ATPase n=1 Tax=Mycobacterium pseudokansasii TaxID=2341080 RepID=UPI0007B51624|nr:adenylate/guanylate cyclase domain-containing protein [Mycobacterium pseudokansasii]KZS61953.1 cyclase [Mycobacterium kansasii]VAZ97606.1 Adenylate cyclase 2 [Mycobacterium pseudokansasii]VAZ99058.1 Adenylate cyclase 2 [Mycobacterium pseudokansasii]
MDVSPTVAADASCRSCGSAVAATAKFCSECGEPLISSARSAEYKQVTVLFADVVRSMDIAALLGAERLREIMAEVFTRSATAVQRYGGTVDKFTGDGIMAVFGAPAALEDHALRACLAAVAIQREIQPLAGDIERDDGVALRLRVGLNSGQVIAGEIGSGPAGYTAIGEQVGMAQRMESAAPPGGVMISESTARLVENAAVLGDSELVQIKGTDVPVPAHRLLAVGDGRTQRRRREPTLVGRTWELSTLTGILDQAVGGHGCVAGVVGPPGIGKSRTVGEATRLAADRGVEIFATYCESHTRDAPFHVVARLLRAVFGTSDSAADAARGAVRARVPAANPEDLLLLNDLLGIGDPATALPPIPPDARWRRLTALLNATALARTPPAVYVIEDAHWIDEASDGMLAEFATVVPQTRSLVLVTYRPEYRGPLSHPPGGQKIALAPLNADQTRALAGELLGSHPSVAGLSLQIIEQALGNPFFVEEIVRDLAGRGVLDGDRGRYVCRRESAAISLPGTLQATIAARIDRLPATAKSVLYAGAVIGARFTPGVLNTVMGATDTVPADLSDLLQLELIDQVRFTPDVEYAFRHPLVRAVAYESQLKTERTEIHRRVAAVIEQHDPGSADQNAALIAEHLEAAGDLVEAFDWHLRAGAWSRHRDLASARTSWQRARTVADGLPTNDPARVRLQIQSQTLLCATAFLAARNAADTGFEELRELCTAAGDEISLAIGMSGIIMALAVNGRARDAAQLAGEFTELVESIADPTLTVALFYAGCYAKLEAGEVREAWRMAQRAVDQAAGDPTKGSLIFGSPLAMATGLKGFVGICLGMPGWQANCDAAIVMAASIDPTIHVMTVMWKHVLAIPFGALAADTTALAATAEALRIAEQTGDELVLGFARLAHGVTQIHHGGAHRDDGLALLVKARQSAARQRFVSLAIAVVDPEIARHKVRQGDLDGAIELARSAVDDSFASGEMIWRWLAVTAMVESLLARGTGADLKEAQSVIDRLAAVPTDPGFVLHELPLLRLRGLVALAHGDAARHDEFMASLRARAAALGFEPLAAAATSAHS